jgi:uncharacterized protein YjgD (DUF1641 family)
MNKDVSENVETDVSENVSILMRQTGYTLSEAYESIKRNVTVEKCIEEYLGVTRKKNNYSTTNQGIYKVIRDWMNGD